MAVVEPERGAEVTLARLAAFLESHAVTKAFWPEELVAVERLPRNDVGKLVARTCPGSPRTDSGTREDSYLRGPDAGTTRTSSPWGTT